MTAQMNGRTTDHRPTATTGPIVPPRRRLPRRLAQFGIAATACVAGIGGLVDDANNHPPPSSTDSPNRYGTAQRVVQESIDVAPLGDGTAHRPIQDTIDVAPAAGDAGLAFDTGRLRQPDTPDGPVTQYVTTTAGVRVPLDEIIADLEANSENQLPVPTPVPRDEIIADPEAKSENQLPVPSPVPLDEIIADLEANSENHLLTRNASPLRRPRTR